MINTIYIIKHEDIFNLRVRSSHCCLSTSDTLEGLLLKAKHIQKTYKTPERLQRLLTMTDTGGRVGKATYEMYESIYLERSLEYDKALSVALGEAREEVKFDTPFHRIKKTIKRTEKVITEESKVIGVPVAEEVKVKCKLFKPVNRLILR